MDTNRMKSAKNNSTAPRRRRTRSSAAVKPIILLSAILAFLLGFAVFGRGRGMDGILDPAGMTSLQLPETVEIKSLILPSGTPIQAEELVAGLEGTGIHVSFTREPSANMIGQQMMELVFERDGAKCTHTVSVTRFRMITEISREMGSDRIPGIRDFVPDVSIDASFKGTSPETLPVDSCGVHTLVIECGGREYEVTYLVTEDIPPTGVGLTVTVEAGSMPAPEALVDQIEDHSEVTVTYGEEPETITVGTKEVTLLLTDAFGNQGQVTAVIDVVPAENGPQFTGLDELRIQVGSTISYKAGVSATDLQDGELSFSVDPGDVDNKTVGTYTAYYTATDSDGLTVRVPRTVAVLDEVEIAVEQYARDVLRKIITEDMTVDEKIYKIYRYTKDNVLFVGTSDKSDVAHGAYEGFTTGKGDCYTYYAMNAVLLNAAGIENLEVTRVGGTSNHWWNLVLYGDGRYYHVDSCPKSIYLDGQIYYKMTETDLEVYTNNRKVAAHRPNYYTYDKTLPEYQQIDIAP